MNQDGSINQTQGTDDLTDRIARLSPAKRALLDLTLKKNGSNAYSEERISGRTHDGSAPLSFAQQRLWFLDQLQRGSPLYNVPYSFQLIGRLNTAALIQSLNEMVHRHESLRTTFLVAEGQPIQVIAPRLTINLPVIDLSSRPVNERHAEALRLATEEALRPFDLSRGPLLRVTLLRLDQQEHVLLLTIHHIVSDGWSTAVLFRELSALYAAFSTGKLATLPELPIQYADFAAWQREWLQGEVLKEQLSYWKKQLAGSPARLELPTDRPRPVVQAYRGARQSVALSQASSERLKILTRDENASLFMTLLAAFQTLLQRYTGQEDIVVGFPIAGRNRAEIEGLIGFFVNTLVLRTDFSGDPSFRELLGRVRKVALDAYGHQDVPFEKLVEELHPQRNFSHSPLFQAMFVFQNAPVSELRLAELNVAPLKIESDMAKFDLTLAVTEQTNSLHVSLGYNTDLFDGTTIARMLGHFQTLLEGIVSNPDGRLSELPLLTQAERQQLLVEWNDTKKDYVTDKCIHELFEAQVEQSPDAVAVIFEDEEVTYRELNARANRLAHYLGDLGVGPDTLVGICMERSLDMVVGLTAILKAGGAYVPLDPAYPQDRLAFMLEDSEVPILLTQKRLVSVLPPYSGQVVCLDNVIETDAVEAARILSNPVKGITPDNLAYVIYTSGSTGKPKGVLINHSNVTRLLHATHSWFHFDHNDVWTLFHSYAFDFSVWEMWGALLYGGRLVVVPYWASRSPEMFYTLLSEKNVTVLNQTPSAFRQLIQAEASSIEPDELALRLVIFGGEALDFRVLRPWLDRHGDRRPRLVNMYGITETTVHVTYRPITAADLSGSRDSLIGVKIPDLEVYVLDQNQNPVPIGVPGELCVGGAGVGRGYLKRPELTAERFIPNPFRPGQGERLYRSGDLVRYLPNRDIEYVGRIDSQVKIRGFRIELGEIEAILSQHAAVREVVVVLREDETTEKRLVAYMVSTEQAPTVSELNGFLRQRLPEYMVPASFVFLHALPLTPNGKVDRNVLPAPDYTRLEQQEALVAPRDGLELQLRQIWEKVLGVRPIGIRDNFFDLGGHSLLAVRLFAQIEKVMGKNLPVAALFHAPTIEQLAGLMSRQDWSAQWKSLVAIQPGGSKAPFFCVHAHDGGVLFWRDLARHLGSDQPVYALQPQGLDGRQPPHSRIEEMAAHYIKEIRTLQPEGPYFIGGHCIGGLIAFEMAQQLHRQGERVGLLALFDSYAPRRNRSARSSLFYRYRYKAIRLLEMTVGLHVNNLLILEPEERLSYVKEKFNKALYKLYMGLGSSWIRAARHRRNILKAGSQAARNYDPKIYPGKITLFRATNLGGGIEHDPQMGWGRLAGGGLETHLIPGYHAHIVLEPRVRVLATQLIAVLERAQKITGSERIAGEERSQKRDVPAPSPAEV